MPPFALRTASFGRLCQAMAALRRFPHQQNGHRSDPHDAFGITAHGHPQDAAAPVRAHHDEIGRPQPRLLDDEIRRRSAHRFDHQRIGLDLLSPPVRGGLRQQRFAALTQRLDEITRIDIGTIAAAENELIHDMHQADSAAECPGNFDRFVEGASRRFTAVDRDQNISVHADLPAARQPRGYAAAFGTITAAGCSLRTSNTGMVAIRITCSASLPNATRRSPLRPCVPMTIRSA